MKKYILFFSAIALTVLTSFRPVRSSDKEQTKASSPSAAKSFFTNSTIYNNRAGSAGLYIPYLYITTSAGTVGYPAFDDGIIDYGTSESFTLPSLTGVTIIKLVAYDAFWTPYSSFEIDYGGPSTLYGWFSGSEPTWSGSAVDLTSGITITVN